MGNVGALNPFKVTSLGVGLKKWRMQQNLLLSVPSLSYKWGGACAGCKSLRLWGWAAIKKPCLAPPLPSPTRFCHGQSRSAWKHRSVEHPVRRPILPVLPTPLTTGHLWLAGASLRALPPCVIVCKSGRDRARGWGWGWWLLPLRRTRAQRAELSTPLWCWTPAFLQLCWATTLFLERISSVP